MALQWLVLTSRKDIIARSPALKPHPLKGFTWHKCAMLLITPVCALDLQKLWLGQCWMQIDD